MVDQAHSTPPPGPQDAAPSIRGAWVAGLFVTGGWLLADLAVFAERGAARAFVELLGDSAAALAIGAAVGLLCSGRHVARAAFAGLALANAASLAVRLPVSATFLVGLRAALVWALAVGLVRLVLPAGRVGLMRSALAALGLGVAAAVAQISLRYGLSEQGTRVLFGAGALLAGAGWPTPAGGALRAVTVPLVGAAATAWLLWPGLAAERARSELRRPDLEPALTQGAQEASPSRPSLVLIVLDTVRADRLGCYGYERDTTPHLDAFATTAVRYTQARSTSSWTLPSHASLFTGLRPAQHGATHPRAGGDDTTLDPAWPAQPLRADVPTLAERLRERGYATAAIVANPLYLRHEFGLDRGFAHYDDRDPASVPHYLALPQLFGRRPWVANRGYRDAREITELALNWLSARPGRTSGTPFFLALNYMDAHMPYLPSAPFDRAFSDERPERPLAAEQRLHGLLYDRELAGLDAQVGRLLDQLDALAPGTAVVVTSDHGEAFGEHGFWKHDWTLYDEVVRVPLLVRAADSEGPGRIEPTPLDGAEVHDLLADLVGLELPAREPSAVHAEWYRVEDDENWEATFGGVDLDRDLVSWVEGGRKLVVSSAGSVEAYDLLADPDELTPLILSEDERATALARARTWWRAHPPPDLATGELDEQTLERMRALGYLDDGKGLDED